MREGISLNPHSSRSKTLGKEKRPRIWAEAEGGMVGYDGVQEKCSPEIVSPGRLAQGIEPHPEPSEAGYDSRRHQGMSYLAILPPFWAGTGVREMETLLHHIQTGCESTSFVRSQRNQSLEQGTSIHSFTRYLRSTCYTPGSVSGSRDAGNNPGLMELTF